MSVRRSLLVLLAVLAIVIASLPAALERFGLGPDATALLPRGTTQPLNGGRALHYHDIGSGDPVVLIHGLPGTGNDWQDVAASLAKKHRVISYDRTGYGFSAKGQPDDEKDFTFESNRADLAALLDVLGIERAALVGWSYGGGVAQTFAVRHPERVSKIVLVASVGPSFELGEENDPLGWLERLGSSGFGVGAVNWLLRVPPLAAVALDGTLATAFSGADAVPPGYDVYAIAMGAQPGTAAAYVAESARADFSVLDPSKVAAPTLVIHGNDDQLVPFAVAEALVEQLPNARLSPVFEGSHMLPLTHADALAESIADFLAP